MRNRICCTLAVVPTIFFGNFTSIFTLMTVTWCCGFRDCEPVAKVSSENRGSALGVSTAFVDVSLGVSGPVAGIVVSRMGYPLIFLFAAAMAGVSVILILLVRVLDARSGYGNHDDDNRVDPKARGESCCRAQEVRGKSGTLNIDANLSLHDRSCSAP